MKTSITRSLFFLILGLFAANYAEAAIEQVPEVLSAPVLLYDEANNLLADGDYNIQVTIKDIFDTNLYQEEHSIAVKNGIANIALGSGYAVGSDFSSSAGGLGYEVFNVAGDVLVEVLVEGQANPQEIAVFGSQPYAFISQYALQVANESVTSNKIADGTIRADDLDESFLSEILNSNVVIESSDGNSEINFSAKAMPVSSDIGLNNASGSNVEDVLVSLDNAIDSVKSVYVDQKVESLEDEIASLSTNSSSSLDSHASSNTGVHGVSGEVVGTNNSQNLRYKTLDSTNAVNTASLTGDRIPMAKLDSKLMSDDDINTFVSTLIGHSEDELTDEIDGVKDRVTDLENYDIQYTDLPVYGRPLAFGTVSWTPGDCNGWNVRGVSLTTYGCDFNFYVPSDDRYVVTFSPRDNTVAMCSTSSRTSTGFIVSCYCPLDNSICRPETDFAVYYYGNVSGD